MSQAAQPNAQLNTRTNSHADTPSAAGVAVLGRVLISAIFQLSGASKLAAPAAMIGYIQSVGLPLPQVALAIAIVVEVVGGIAAAACRDVLQTFFRDRR